MLAGVGVREQVQVKDLAAGMQAEDDAMSAADHAGPAGTGRDHRRVDDRALP